MREKIALGFSGGLDSTIAAIKLDQAGYEVHAVYLDLWKWNKTPEFESRIEQRINDLRKILKIEFALLDAEERMQSIIVSDFRDQIKRGFTPNPCIRCNPMVKMRLITEYANLHGIQNIATGHYARIEKRNDQKFTLLKGIDSAKDQSYMLCFLNQVFLAKLILPLGTTIKKENRLLARKFGLSVVDEPESQDLCFLNEKSIEEFIRQFSPEILIEGEIVDTNGNILGRHGGLPLYTIGQRKGIRISSKKPYYVIEKNIIKNQLIVGYDEELGKGEMDVGNVNWIRDRVPDSFVCDVKIRYQSKMHRCKISTRTNMKSCKVKFFEKIRDITPGQYAVFYEEDEVLGGGMILKDRQINV